MTADKIFVDASQPATLRHAGGSVECPTVQEAVIAWHKLPGKDRHQATIQVSGGALYTADEIDRLHYGPRMHGQWLGTYSGMNMGTATVDIDEVGNRFRGYAYLFDNNTALPNTRADINIDKPAKTSLKARLPLAPIDRHTGEVSSWASIARNYPPGTQFPEYADVEMSWSPNQLTVSWVTNINTSGSMTLPATKAGDPSDYAALATVTNWAEFKNFALDLDPDRYIFRGQENSKWRLRTSFHRAGRANLERFLLEDVPRLHKHLSARTRHVFDMRKPEEHGAFVSLAQHHGYPTPLLDWTRSAFVGAYFAYRKVRNSDAMKASSADQKVRIYVFDRERWGGELIQFNKLAPAQPHLSLLDALAIENARMIPQQALSTITNVDDVESHIRLVEKYYQKNFLQVIELPVQDRPLVINELQQMGITAGSMFPGLDGACEALKEQYFPLA